MATQRDFAVTLKKEMTLRNVYVLSKFQNMSTELTRLMLKENALEKPTQQLFNHLSYYLITIIDSNVCSSLTWPVYDSKGERTFRNEIASFISDYSSKGLLSPVMSSYLVNPGCYKVTVLMFQMSQLAVNRMLLVKMKSDRQKKLYTEMTEKYKSHKSEGFIECIDKETQLMRIKLTNYLSKRKTMEQIAELFRKKIEEMEKTLSIVNAQSYIDNLVEGFIKTHEVDEDTKSELQKIKDINQQSQIFDVWLTHIDNSIDSLDKTWDTKITSLLRSTKTMYETTEAIITRATGECDRSTYTVEYNHKNDEICTKDLQNQVNSQQKYILKNIVKDGQLNFPNLIRAFIISISFILKNNEIGDEIYSFNEYLEGGRRNYSEIVSAMRGLIERILDGEAKLQPTTSPYDFSLSIKDLPEIPPLPNLSNLKASRDCNQVLFDAFTPLHVSKYQFNLRRKNNTGLFVKPQMRSLITPFHTGPRDDFLKSIISCRNSSYYRQSSQENHNYSVMSQMNRGNETIAECSSGLTKQQILRLLSTKKTSSSKKFKYSTERPNIAIKKGGLFNESVTSNESNGLVRSYSSPNLFENKEKRCYSKVRDRQLSVMQEDSPSSILDMSGIATLNREINSSTPQDTVNAGYKKNIDTSSLPMIAITSDTEDKINNILNVEHDFETEMGINSLVSPILDKPRKSVEIMDNSDVKTETPKTNTQLIRKTSSLEKIINRFKKVRANILPEKKDECTDIKTILEEKENVRAGNIDSFTANRILLPDLLSPTCSSVMDSNINTDYMDQICGVMDEVETKKTRQSLGTVLGVDQSFLDQFDLID